MTVRPVFLLALLTALAAPDPVAAQGAIGELGAANQEIAGTPPGTARRVLMLGSEVVQDERISTSDSGSGQVMFLDQTTLSIAPGSDVVLDRYVYDPDRGAGEIGLSVTRGALRFIGGRITKQNEAIIQTPTATIGIRGGAAVVVIGDNGEVEVIHVAGDWTRILENGAGVTLLRSGARGAAGDGQGPRMAGTASAEEIDALYRRFEGGGGGLPNPPDDALAEQGLRRGVSPFAGGELGGARRRMVSTSGASLIGDIPPEVVEGERENAVLPPGIADATPTRDDGGTPPDDGGGPPTDDGGGGEPTTVTRETPLPGVSGVAIFASATPFIAPNGARITDPAGQNVLASDGTIDPLAETLRGETGTEEDGVFTPVLTTRIGINALMERYVVPINPAGGTQAYTEGASPITAPIMGDSRLDSATDFTAAFYEDGARSQVFFGRGTPGQLGTPQGVSAPQLRQYALRDDPFLDSTIPMLDPSIGALFGTPPDVTIEILEEDGEGLFREDGSFGFAKIRTGILGINGEGVGQKSLFVVGTGRVTPTAANAPSPDMGFFGTVQDGTGSPHTIEGTAGLLASGDGSTLFGPNAENFVLASSSRFIFDADEDFETTPAIVDSWEGPSPEPRGFAHVGDLTSAEEIEVGPRLPLGIPFGTAVELFGFNVEDDDTALTSGYAAALGRSAIAGVVSDTYILHSAGAGTQMSFDSSQNEANATLTMIGGPSRLGPTEGPPDPPEGDIRTARFGFGSRSTRSALIDDKNFLMRNRTTTDLGFVPGETNINGDTGRSAPAGGEQQAFRGALASSGAVGSGDDGIFGTGVDTEHEYLRWGYWSGEFRFEEDTGDAAGAGEGGARAERYHLGTWVSGNTLDEEFFPPGGMASFDGFAVVSVSEAGRDFVDGGGFALTYDFANRAGEASFTDLAGYDFKSAVSGNRFTLTPSGADRDHYAGFIANAGTDGRPAVDGTVAGSFLTDSVGSELRGTAGRIDFQSAGDGGDTLRASGVFGGDVVTEPGGGG